LTRRGTRSIVGSLLPDDPARDDELLTNAQSFIPVCSWCGRYALEGTWRRFSVEEPLLHDLAPKRPTHTICDECFARLRASGQSH